MITSIKMLVTKEEKKKFASFVVADLYGDVECVMFPKTFDKLGEYLNEKNVIVVKVCNPVMKELIIELVKS